MKITKTLIVSCLSILAFAACKKKTEELSSPPLSDYFPLQVGKYVIYRLDSTVLLPFGSGFTTRSYRAKDVVDAVFTDNQGRKSYRIYRSITDTNGIAPYRNIATYYATPNGTDWMEYVDNNLRFMKLRWPIRQATQWQGNSLFIDAYGSSSNIVAQYYANWTYQYDSVGMPYTLLGKTYDSTVKVNQRDETIPEGPLTPSTLYQQRNYSVERYAKGIGLIYKDFLHYIWQTNNGQLRFEDESYGLRLRIIDHN
jgi:hypothetical protein